MDIMGTIKGGGQFFLIGQGASGNVFVQGVLVDPGPCRASYVLGSTDGSIDFGTWEISPLPR